MGKDSDRPDFLHEVDVDMIRLIEEDLRRRENPFESPVELWGYVQKVANLEETPVHRVVEAFGGLRTQNSALVRRLTPVS